MKSCHFFIVGWSSIRGASVGQFCLVCFILYHSELITQTRLDIRLPKTPKTPKKLMVTSQQTKRGIERLSTRTKISSFLMNTRYPLGVALRARNGISVRYYQLFCPNDHIADKVTNDESRYIDIFRNSIYLIQSCLTLSLMTD